MSAPSSVETSTSTGSGDWLNQEGGGTCWPTSSLSSGFLPALRSQTDDPPALSEVSWGGEGWGDRLIRDGQYGIIRAQKLQGREGEPAVFFFCFLVFLNSLFVFFFLSKTKWSLSALSLLILTVVSECTRVGERLLNLLVLFKLFWKIGKGRRGISKSKPRQFYIINSSSSPSSPDVALKQTALQYTVSTLSE